MANIIKKLLYIGIFLVFSLIVFEYVTKKYQQFVPTPPGLTYPALSKLDSPVPLLDPEGVLQYNGYGINQSPYYSLNHSQVYVPGLPTSFAQIKSRNWNFYQIYTPDIVIQIPLTDFSIVCFANILIYNRSDPDIVKNRLNQAAFFQCPDINLTSVHQSNFEFIGKSHSIKGELIGDTFYLNLKAEKLNFEANLYFKESDVESQFWTMALNQNKNLFFMNNKKFGMITLGEYTLNNVTKSCNQGECLAIYDIGRGYFNYYTNWFWASITTKINGDIVSVNLGDGIGVENESKEKAYEDFISINGKIYKLEQTRMQHDINNYYEKHLFKTVLGSNNFYGRHCKLEFEPIDLTRDGINLSLIAFTQRIIFGYWTGTCIVEEKQYEFERVLGMVEHMSARW